MTNVYEQQLAIIKDIKRESIDSKRFILQFKDKKLQNNFDFIHGQFMMVGLAGWGEAPFDLCGNHEQKNLHFEITIRAVGPLTMKLRELKRNDEVLVRGPFGNGLPAFADLEKKNLLLIGGGCGAVTLRSILEEYVSNNFKRDFKMQVFWGCLDESTILFKDRHNIWQKKVDFNLILEKPSKNWRGEKGLVTKLFDAKNVLVDASALVVGPPVMYGFVIPKLKEHGFRDQDIFLSFERRMYCGVGVCQHCAIGPYYVCKDGPVFRYDVVKSIRGTI